MPVSIVPLVPLADSDGADQTNRSFVSVEPLLKETVEGPHASLSARDADLDPMHDLANRARAKSPNAVDSTSANSATFATTESNANRDLVYDAAAEVSQEPQGNTGVEAAEVRTATIPLLPALVGLGPPPDYDSDLNTDLA